MTWCAGARDDRGRASRLVESAGHQLVWSEAIVSMPVHQNSLLFALPDACLRTKNMLIWRRSDALERLVDLLNTSACRSIGLKRRNTGALIIAFPTLGFLIITIV